MSRLTKPRCARAGRRSSFAFAIPFAPPFAVALSAVGISLPCAAHGNDAGAGTGTAAVVVVGESNRTTTIEVSPVLGASLERAFASEAYALAVASDRDERWSEAAALYHQAIAEWSSRYRYQPSAELERAILKADRERQRSQLLAGVQAQRDKLPPATLRGLALERGRIYRTKLMSVRAYTGAVPTGLLARTRHELEEALRLADTTKPGADTEARLLLCATRAAGGDRPAARLELAHVPSSEREDPASLLPLAVCQAALGNLPTALVLLEAHVRRQPVEQRLDTFALRDLYLANDWDRLRGDLRFESLFSAVRHH
ncbi:MAG TPA: hypothetical protein VFH68_05205 [Polyangia bacterium]|nr:hypothetical protein [Polyangia bacterium]